MDQVRSLIKGPIPPIVAASGPDWTKEYVAAVSQGRDGGTPWRHPQIVAALKQETLAKCAYCEGVIADVSYPHVEHILPKSRRPELVVEWHNLTLGCTVCNTNKGDYYEPDAPLLQPYTDNPLEHLVFHGFAIYAVLGSDTGIRTIENLKLMRSPLMLERMKRIQSFHWLLDRWQRAEGADHELFAGIIRDQLADDQEFVQTLRSYAAAMGFSP
jgi:hypothetical protein